MRLFSHWRWIMRETRQEVGLHGFFAGALGYASVVVFFAAFSTFAGKSPLDVPAAMGYALFPGLATTAETAIGAALAFNGVHLLLSLGVGLLVAWLMYEAETHHQLWYVVTLVLIGGFIFGLLAMGVLGSEIAHAISWNAVLFGNVLWAGAMAATLYRFHRGLVAEVEADQLGAAN